MRNATIHRKTSETDISLSLTVLDGTPGALRGSCGIGFFDHMLNALCVHGSLDLTLSMTGDLSVDTHHSLEDLGLVLGEAFAQALGDKRGIRRYGSFLLPMDESLVMVALDLSGRPYLVYDLEPPTEKVGTLDTALFHEFFQAFCVKGGINLHVKLLAGGETHHVFEALFKGCARALQTAVSIDPEDDRIPSTKGVL